MSPYDCLVCGAVVSGLGLSARWRLDVPIKSWKKGYDSRFVCTACTPVFTVCWAGRQTLLPWEDFGCSMCGPDRAGPHNVCLWDLTTGRATEAGYFCEYCWRRPWAVFLKTARKVYWAERKEALGVSD